MITYSAQNSVAAAGFLRRDVLAALKNGSITMSERRGQQWRRVVRGCDLDGQGMILTVTISYPLRRITVLEFKLEPANDES